MLKVKTPNLLLLYNIQFFPNSNVMINKSFFLEDIFFLKKNKITLIARTTTIYCNKLTPAKSQQFSINEDC